MVDKVRQSGRPSRLAYGKQSAVGTYQAPTDIFNATTFDINVAGNRQHYETLNGQLFAVSESREGIAKVTFKAAGPMRGRQAIGLLAGAIGTDTLSSAGASTSLGTVGAAGSLAGAQTIPLTGALTAPPTGISSWEGATFTIGTGGTQEDVGVCSYTTTNLFTTGTKFNHVSTETIVVNKQHCLQMKAFPNQAQLDNYSFMAQWADVTEQQALDTLVYMVGIKADAQAVTLDLEGCMNTMIQYDGDVTTTVTPSATELADRPFKSQDLKFLTYGAAADTFMKPHTRFTNLDFKFQYAVQEVIEGGSGALSVVKNVLGKAGATLSWTDTAGEAAFATFRQDFVTGTATTPAMIWGINAKTLDTMGLWIPQASADNYDLVGPTDAAVDRQGQLTVELDLATSGVPFRLWIKNPATSAY